MGPNEHQPWCAIRDPVGRCDCWPERERKQAYDAGVAAERERVKALINTMGAKTGGFIALADFYAAVRDGKEP